jgi:hypothetical protein
MARLIWHSSMARLMWHSSMARLISPALQPQWGILFLWDVMHFRWYRSKRRCPPPIPSRRCSTLQHRFENPQNGNAFRPLCSSKLPLQSKFWADITETAKWHCGTVAQCCSSSSTDTIQLLFCYCISLFYISHSNVNQISYFKDTVSCKSKGLLSCSLKMAL